MPRARAAVYPRPKSFEPLAGKFLISHALRVVVERAPEGGGAEAQHLANSIGSTIGRTPRVLSGVARTGDVHLRLHRPADGVAEPAEGYALDIGARGAQLTAASASGLFYAGRTLLALLRRSPDGTIAAPACRIRDWPDFPCRGLLLNVATTFATMKELDWQLDLLARNKMNVLHMNFADAVSFTLPTRRFPRLNVPPNPAHNGVYSRSDLRRLVTEATARHIEVLPGINMPGHARYWLAQYPELKCEAPNASTWVMCVGQERTFDMIEGLFDELLPLFPSPFVHIGTDELEFRDALDRVWLSWRECPHCRRRMAQEGLAGARALFYYFVRRIHAMLARRGKRLMMWNDNVDSSRPVDLPGDVRMHFWRIPIRGRGPHVGCSFNRLAARGFEVVNSHYPSVYIDSHARDESLLNWHPERRPPVQKALRNRVLGGIGCSWRGRGKYPPEYYVPPFLAMLGDRLWNREAIHDPDAFAHGLARHLFGPRAPDVLEDLFHVGGRIIHDESDRHDGPGVLAPLSAAARRKRIFQLMTALKEMAGPQGWDPLTAQAFLAQLRSDSSAAERSPRQQ